jgi:tetratricopeptide (TPR) repeat protein
MNTTTIKKTLFSLAAVGLLVATFLGLRAMSKQHARKDTDKQSSLTSVKESPADVRIKSAQSMIEKAPTDPAGYNLLAAAYSQKARETGDFSLNAKVDEALTRSLQLEPDNYDALKLRSKLLLTFHRFSEALEVARRAQTMRPQDHDVYGALTDALVELGEYDEAVKAAQKMVDLRPGTASYSRVSYLRELHGDIEGAIEAMKTALRTASPQDPENLTWCRVQLANLLMHSGKLSEAEREIDKALQSFPDYHLALDAQARARIAAGDIESAVAMYKREQEQDPDSADAALALGDLASKNGQADEAKRQYERFETLERINAVEENDWHHLVYYWADHDLNLEEAVNLARRARESRKDIHTCDALAWTLFKRGQFAESKTAIDEAMRLGTKDAKILYHAGLIYNEIGDRRKAANYLTLALKTNASFDVLQAAIALRVLNTINT